MERVNGENSHCNKNLNNYREERMIKKIFMSLILVLAFTACQSLDYVKEKNETIQLVVKGNDNNIYMLGNKSIFWERCR